MAVIHETTMTPRKLELLAPWLPAQPWYAGAGHEPRLAKVGGFRLDDPEGEVGIEFMVAADEAGDPALPYHLPLTYRGAPLDGADHALIGTAEHGVLGRRWIYDGVHDPVLLTQLLALLQGRAEPQAQSVSHTPDPSVTGHFDGEGFAPEVESADVGPHGTDLTVRTAEGRLTLEIVRVLRDGPADGARGHVTAGWRSPGGGTSRGPLVLLRDTPS